MRGFLIILPLAAYAVWFLAARLRGNGWRASMIHAAALWGVLVVVFTEGLGAARALTAPGLAAVWLAAAAAGGLYALRVWRVRHPGRPLREILGSVLPPGLPEDSEVRIYTAGTILVIATVGLIAVTAPPNTWDAMEYHMPRVLHWIGNRSVDFYPTNEIKALYMPPWAEYAILHFHALSGGDRFDNLVQWFSLAGSLAAVTLLAQLLGAGARGQALAGLAAATIPQGILQASGAKNDFVVSFWLLAAAYYVLLLRQSREPGAVAGAGVSAGLACLTKGTAYVLAPPLLAVLFPAWMLKERKRAIRYAAAAAAAALLLNLPHYIRNYRLFGEPLGPSAIAPPRGFKVSNDRYGVGTTLSNILRNVALHAATPSNAANARLSGWIAGALKAAGIDPNDPATTWDWTTFSVPEMSRHEATAGNPLHLALVGAALWLVGRRFRSPEWRPALLLSVAAVVMFLCFCAALKWQPWHTRLHLPLFLLGSALIGFALASRFAPAVTGAAAVLLLVNAAPALLENQLRPLLYAGEFNVFNRSREALRFQDNRALLEPYTAAAEFAAAQSCDQIGVDLTAHRYYYPLHFLLTKGGQRQIREVAVANASASLAGPDQPPSTPCVVICPGCTLLPEKVARYTASGRHRVFGNVIVQFPSANACTAAFSGWYPAERNGPDWWRWSSGKSEIRISVERGMQARLEGQLSSLRQPNRVLLFVNGERSASLEVRDPGFQPIPAVPLSLRAGVNTVEMVSVNEAGTWPGDTRALAMAIRNARIAGEDTVCSVEP